MSDRPATTEESGLRRADRVIGRYTAAWVDGVTRRPRVIAIACALATLAAAAIAVPRLGLNSDEDALFSPKVRYAELRRDFAAAFPMLMDPVIVLIDGPDGESATAASNALRARLESDPAHFPRVLDPTARSFFESRGLLYLSTAEVEDTIDKLIAAQPLLAEYAGDPSLRGFAEVVARALGAQDDETGGSLDGLDAWLNALSESAESWAAAAPRPLETAALFGAEGDDASRRYLLIQPVVDHKRLEPAAETLQTLGAVLDELGLRGGGATRARVTGLYALSAEEAHLVERQAKVAGLASLVLVSMILFVGIGSRRIVVWILLTLLAGLAWCAAFAAVAIGHLNLVSVAFGVLFIGLSVDFGIHFVLRFLELRQRGATAREALRQTAHSVGASLVICAGTTALAFFAFVPTAFIGVAELGLIAGFGMFASLFLNLTLLPALMSWGGAPVRRSATSRSGVARHRVPWPAIATGVAVFAALPLLPGLHFDTNPLRVRDPNAESVRAFEALLADGAAFPWNLNVLVDDANEAAETAGALRKDPAIGKVLWLEDLVPEEQDQKLALLEDASMVMGPALVPQATRVAPTAHEDHAALVALRSVALAEGGATASRLGRALDQVLADDDALAVLGALWIAPMNRDLDRMRDVLRPVAVDAATLPADLRDQRVSRDGRFRIEVFPRGDIGEGAVLARFVAAVQRVDPDAFGEGMVIHESGQIVVEAFRRALLVAALGVLTLLWLLWRNLADTALVAVPIVLASILCAAGTRLLGIPLNYANVIVIPLLVGMGVDSGIHLVHRLRYEAADGALLQTSTARSVLFSAFTTLASFGTLAFTPHRGMASLGQLLALGIAMILLCNFAVLPALARWWRKTDLE